MANEMSVVALCEITSPEGTEKIKTFDKAWVRALELPRPVKISLVDFVRKD